MAGVCVCVCVWNPNNSYRFVQLHKSVRAGWNLSLLERLLLNNPPWWGGGLISLISNPTPPPVCQEEPSEDIFILLIIEPLSFPTWNIALINKTIESAPPFGGEKWFRLAVEEERFQYKTTPLSAPYHNPCLLPHPYKYLLYILPAPKYLLRITLFIFIPI